MDFFESEIAESYFRLSNTVKRIIGTIDAAKIVFLNDGVDAKQFANGEVYRESNHELFEESVNIPGLDKCNM